MVKTILVVDDEPDILKIIAFKLEVAGFKVIKAKDGEKALSYIKKRRPNLILLDLLLPGIDGYEVFKIIKKDNRLKNIPIILIPATENIKSVNEKLKSFCIDSLLLKPFEFDDLLKEVNKFIG